MASPSEGADLKSLGLELSTELMKLVNERFAKTEIGSAVTQHRMHLHATRFLQCRENFRQAGKPINITTAFHYTSSKNIESILQDGLDGDRKTRHGRKYGQGVYVATNPQAFSCYGTTGMLLMIIHGTTRQLTFNEKSTEFQADCYLGNKLTETNANDHFFPKTSYFDEGANPIQSHATLLAYEWQT